MPITELLERNARDYGGEVALVEINPDVQEIRRVTWKEYELIESGASTEFRREITWSVFDEKANRCANLLMSRGIRKGHRVGILLMNCLEWLPCYFGVLKTGALAVPMNFRYTGDEIEYCLDLADVRMLVFGPEFIDRLNQVRANLKVDNYFFVGDQAQDPVSLETPVGEEDDSHLGDFIQDNEASEPLEATASNLLREQLEKAMASLTPREEKVLRLRFGFEDGKPHTLEEVGKKFNVTRERVRQIESKALRRLRHPSKSKALRDFVN